MSTARTTETRHRVSVRHGKYFRRVPATGWIIGRCIYWRINDNYEHAAHFVDWKFENFQWIATRCVVTLWRNMRYYRCDLQAVCANVLQEAQRIRNAKGGRVMSGLLPIKYSRNEFLKKKKIIIIHIHTGEFTRIYPYKRFTVRPRALTIRYEWFELCADRKWETDK